MAIPGEMCQRCKCCSVYDGGCVGKCNEDGHVTADIDEFDKLVIKLADDLEEMNTIASRKLAKHIRELEF